MPQPHPLAPRQYRPSVAPGYETTSRYASSPAYDAGLLARHEYRQRQASAPATELERNRRLLELRRRRLALLR